MSAHIEYRCDICAATGVGRLSWMRTPDVPKGWHRYGDKHLCSYDCLIAHLNEVRSRAEADELMPRLQGRNSDEPKNVKSQAGAAPTERSA